MKSKDQQLLEKAYLSTRLIKEESVDDFHNRMMKDESQCSAVVTPEIEKLYYSALEKANKGEITLQQWSDICAKILGDIMNGPERDISEEEDEQMIAADLANKE
jgi:hypothetical protein